jgi:hypothetical protein
MADDAATQHPLDGLIGQLQGFTEEDVRGTARLGSLAFDDAPEKVAAVSGILRDLRLEDWAQFDEGFKNTLVAQAQALVNTLEQMRALDASDPSAATHRENYQAQLDQFTEWFRSTAQPRAFRARLQDELKRADVDSGYEEADRLRRELGELREQLAQTRRDLETIGPVVEAGRAAAGASGAVDLAAEYRKQADDHKEAWELWRWILLGTAAVAIAGSIAVVLIHHPQGQATSAAAVSRFLIDLLVIGLLLYGVRLASLQFRVHRHLDATDRSKAAALATFGRIVASGAEASTRDAVATTLAQAVFTPGETGFIDSGSDHITLVERIIAPAAQRLAPP